MTTPLKTAFDLQCVMQAFATTHVPEPKCITLASVYWFVAMQEAIQLIDAGTKDLANLLLGGSKPIDDAYVADWLESCYEQTEQGGVECYVDFNEAFKRHYGIR